MTVAHAAPTTPSSGKPQNPKTSRMSRTMFRRLEPTRMTIGHIESPTPRSTAVVCRMRSMVIVPSDITSRYSTPNASVWECSMSKKCTSGWEMR